MMYNEKILDRLVNPRNVGQVRKADVSYVYSSPKTTIKLSIKTNNDIVEDCKFKVFSCAVTLAILDVILDKIKGQDIETLLSITEEDVTNELGNLPNSRENYFNIVMEAIKGLVQKYRKKQIKLALKQNEEKTQANVSDEVKTEEKQENSAKEQQDFNQIVSKEESQEVKKQSLKTETVDNSNETPLQSLADAFLNGDENESLRNDAFLGNQNIDSSIL